MLTVAIVVVLVLLVLIVLLVIRRISVCLEIRLVKSRSDSESKKRSPPSATSSPGAGATQKVPPHWNPMGGEPPSAAPVLVLSLFPLGELAALAAAVTSIVL